MEGERLPVPSLRIDPDHPDFVGNVLERRAADKRRDGRILRVQAIPVTHVLAFDVLQARDALRSPDLGKRAGRLDGLVADPPPRLLLGSVLQVLSLLRVNLLDLLS